LPLTRDEEEEKYIKTKKNKKTTAETIAKKNKKLAQRQQNLSFISSCMMKAGIDTHLSAHE